MSRVEFVGARNHATLRRLDFSVFRAFVAGPPLAERTGMNLQPLRNLFDKVTAAPDGDRMRGSLLLFGGLTAGAALLGALTTKPGSFYRSLKKPPFQPPNWVFAPVWTVLYGLIAVSGDRIYRAPSSPERTKALALWAGQLALNAAWSPIFFGLENPKLALLDIGLLKVALRAYTDAAGQVDETAAKLMKPYSGWVGFASLLNGEIVRRNPSA